MPIQSTRDRGLTWTSNPPPEKQLRKDGYTVVRFGDIRTEYIEPSRSVTAKRVTLDNAAASLLRLLDAHPRLAVLGVPAGTLGDLRDVYSFLVEPAFRRDVDLFLGVDRDLDKLDATELVAPDMGYPWTLERLHFIAQRYLRQAPTDGLPPLTPIEEQLLVALRSAELTPQVQYGISRFRVDFAFVPERLVVEADGRAWHDAERDAARDAYLETLGWKTIRFSGSEIYRDIDAVVARITEKLAVRSENLQYTDLAHEPLKSGLWQRILDWFRGRKILRSPDPYEEIPPVPAAIPSWKAELDPDQMRAVNSMEGVVQVIAPAGSGKTTTMIARVQELLSRGVPANRILCTTFNRATREELQDRLKKLGIVGVVVKNFHSLGRLILKEEDQLRGDIGTITYAQWRRLAKMAMDGVNGIWLDAPVSSEIISDYKLAKMWTPAAAQRHAKSDLERTAAEIYRIYEEHLEEADRNDFDDLIISSVRLLQHDGAVRRRWQDKWECVLVDEYQDIEPAQELLIQLLAAPEDSIFAVGDEDQCIYAWRRATVERIVMLDTVYPGLERTVLSTSYRCPPQVTEAARNLIEKNERRFNKPIKANPNASDEGSIDFINASTTSAGAAKVARLLADAINPDSIVVLARTSRLLRDVVEACVAADVAVNAPASAFRPTDAEDTLLAYLRLLSSPQTAQTQDIRTALRVPNRYLPRDQEETVATALKNGETFLGAMQAVTLPDGLGFGQDPQADWGRLMDELSASTDAAQVVQRLRSEGGLDKHYSSVELMSPNDQTEIEALDDLVATSKHKTASELVAAVELRATVLSAGKDGEGVELTTIHGSKGREWDTVILYGADDTQLPHFRSLADAKNQQELNEAIEDERRLAYVAITRTKKKLVVISTSKPSPFLLEAGISTTAGTIPTLAEVHQNTPNPALAATKKKQPKPPGKKGNANGKPATIAAKYPGTCKACKTSIAVGTQIVSKKGLWVHQKC